VGLALACLALVVVDQSLLRTVLADDLFFGVQVAPFEPPLFSPAQFRALERIRTQLAGEAPGATRFDPVLGWCNPPDGGAGEFRYDWAGARLAEQPLARSKAPGVRRIVALGCSMTHGEEVGARDSWCAQLDADLAEVEVANLGVAAYGLDQALLRLQRDGFALEPDEIWLGLLPQAALRVTTAFRPLLDHWSLDVAFKPRFALDAGGGLVPVPCPTRSLADCARLLADQPAFLAEVGVGDPWVQQTPGAYAPRGSDWRHHSFLGRVGLTLAEKRGRGLDAAFDDGHAFGQLLSAIVRQARAQSEARGLRFRLLILPGRGDLEQRAGGARGYWTEWCERRHAEGLEIVDLSEALLADGGGAELFAPQGHLSPRGSRVVAEALALLLRQSD